MATIESTLAPDQDRVLNILTPFVDGRGVVRISERKSKNRMECKVYEVSVGESDFGPGLCLTWVNQDTAEVYTCSVADKNCTCPWMLYSKGDGKVCRHLAASKLLEAEGKLGLAVALSEEPLVCPAGHMALCGA